MINWLVCHKCNVKEAIQKSTRFVHCQTCGSPRYAEGEDGQELIAWSQHDDPLSWRPAYEWRPAKNI